MLAFEAVLCVVDADADADAEHGGVVGEREGGVRRLDFGVVGGG